MTREVKVGLLVVVSIFILFFGLNFLKGIEIFKSTNSYYAVFEDVDGLVKSCPVQIKGYKVGQIEEVTYDFRKSASFVVKLSVSKDISLPRGCTVELFDNGLVGGKAIRLMFKESVSQELYHQPGDTLPSSSSSGLMGVLERDVTPKIESIVIQADSLLRSLRALTEAQSLRNTLASIELTTAHLARGSSQLNRIIDTDFPRIIGDVHALTTDFKQLTGSLKKIDFVAMSDSLTQTLSNLQLFSEKLHAKEGSLGLLINDKDLYFNLSNTADNANKLLIDLQQNPKKYVHFSIFGRK